MTVKKIQRPQSVVRRQRDFRLKEYAARTEAAQDRIQFLTEVSAVIANSPDYEKSLTSVMQLAVPTLADWISVVLLDEKGEFHSIKTLAETESAQKTLEDLQNQTAFIVKHSSVLGHVIQTGEGLLVSHIDDDALKTYAASSEHLDLLRKLNPRSAMVIALRAHGLILGGLALGRLQTGAPYDQDDLALAEGLSHHIAIAIERSRLYHDERKIRETLQTRVQLQALISDLGQQALTSDDLPALMSKATNILTQTLGVEYSKILELQPDKSRLFLKAGVGWRPGHVGKTMLSAGLESQSGFTLLSSQPVIVEDLRTETRFHGPPLFLEHGVISGVSVIIQGHEGPWGVLSIHSTRVRIFTADDIHFVQSVANILGAALEQARWADEVKKAATLQERQRIARELHDAVSQTLFAANLLAESLPHLWERQPDKALERVQQLHGLTRGAAAEMRVLLVELRPESLISANLSYLITQLGYAMPGRKNIDISVKVENWSDQPLPPEVQITFYRIAQESLNNIIKHGEAKQARIRLVRKESHIILTITDMGKGFDMRRMGTGLGLKSMVERANSIRAAFNVRSRIGRGTQVKLIWKIPEESQGTA